MELQGKKYRKLVISGLLFITGMLLTLAADYGIRVVYQDRVIAQDLMFRFIPHLPQFALLADGTIMVSTLYLLFGFSKFKKERLADFLFACGVMYSVRAVLNFVTPLGDPSGDNVTYGFLELRPMLGMFPSGHIGLLSTEFWLAAKWGVPKQYRYILFGFIVIEALALWASRGHYTIDMAAGFVFGYLAVKATMWYWSRHPNDS